MERIGRLTAVLATVMLAWFEPSPCPAQSSAPLPSALPPVRQPTATTNSSPARQGLSTGARSTTRVPPPRPWRPATATPPPDQRPPSSWAAGSPAVDPAVRRGAENMPQPVPPSTDPLIPQPAPRDLMTLELQDAPLEPTDLRFPINLATALRLSDARPLIVAAAQASVWVAEAQLTRAKVLWVPQLNIGGDYIRHDGGGPDFNKGILTAPSVNFFYGGGGLWEVVSLDRCLLRAPGQAADAQFPAIRHPVRQERRPAPDRRRLLPRPPAPGHVCRSPLLRRAGARPGRADRQLEQRAGLATSKSSGPGTCSPTSSSKRPPRVKRGGSPAPASPRSSGSNPRAVVVPLEHDHLQITLIDPARPLPDLHVIALTNRPELASYQALVQAAAGADPPGEGAHAPPHRPDQRLPDSRRDDSSWDLRPRHATTNSTSGPAVTT